ncbi:cytochrome c biogenesis protein CcmG/thiol:disulfide interchange protein DsbE [Sphingomonas insulae]|uniref:DsbE family thiol:disulfide interchange protein n=1 Tax=Sphingomonas insulae TaxID=424800 RepID=A0ABN1HYM4_9SPHN|nr:redoxin family protein [Sphingomonas insulae]NIJ29539.1 cytochrome c biogenesis protein CcmG/thiol:disulfide interchange protein DsbE [Sphingomonas insulae]
MRRWLIWTPFVAFALLFAIVAGGLFKPADRVVRSALVGKPLPDFALPAIAADKPGLSAAAFRNGQPRLLNIFASWCIPCAAESPQLLRLKAMGVPIDAIAIRDTAPALRDFLRRNGDPYDRIGDDRQSAVQLALGSSGVPESFVVDGRGRIVLQHVGDIRADDVATIAAAIRDAR